MMQISCSTTSQRCSIGLRYGDWGGHLRIVNSSCSRNQFEINWVLWHGALVCWKQPWEGYTEVIKGIAWASASATWWLWSLNDDHVVQRSPRCNISPISLCHLHEPKPWIQGWMDPCSLPSEYSTTNWNSLDQLNFSQFSNHSGNFFYISDFIRSKLNVLNMEELKKWW